MITHENTAPVTTGAVFLLECLGDNPDRSGNFYEEEAETDR